MNALIIGGTGFLGRALQAALRELGHQVSITGATGNPGLSNFSTFDVTRDEPVIEEVDAVFYLSQSPFYREFPEQSEHLFSVNALGPLKVARASAEKGVKFFCFTSTGNVYEPSFRALKEDDPVHAGNAYALSKVTGEKALALLDVEMKLLSVRIFGLFGPGQRSMLPYALRQRIIKGQNILLEPSAENERDRDGLRISFLYCPDAARILAGLAEAAVAGRELPKVLNLAGPEAISVKDFAAALGRCLKRSVEFEHAEKARSFDLIADISRLKKLMDPAFTPFEDAMIRTFSGSPE